MSEPARTLRMLADPISEVMPDHLRLNAFVHAGVEAADRIEALEAHARSEAAKALRADGELHEALARIEALEEALRSIANNTCCDGCQEAARVARAALSPTPER